MSRDPEPGPHGPLTSGALIDLLVNAGIPGDQAARVPGIARRFGIKAQPIDNPYNAGYVLIRPSGGMGFTYTNHLRSKGHGPEPVA
jgi:hypothetical protein